MVNQFDFSDGTNYAEKEASDRECFNTPYEGVIELPEWADNIKGVKILHIGDTADEVKIGRISSAYTKSKIKR